MKHSKWMPILLLILLISLFSPIPAHADMAPPEGPPGTNIVPGKENTQVRMVAETVTLTVLPNPAPEFLGQARTEAIFTMRNLGTETETMQARFPLTFPGFVGDPAKGNQEIKDFRVFVDGKSVQTTNILGGLSSSSNSFDNWPWAAFPVTFPPNKDIIVTVRYTTNAEGDPNQPDFALNYILETGAGWKNSIGSADIIVKLPYEASPENITFDPAMQNVTFVGKEVHQHLSDFEPTSETNFYLRPIRIEYWQRVLQYREYVKKYPINGEYWGQLGKAIKESIRYPKGYLRADKVGEKLYKEAVDAYQKSVEFLPEDALWHYGFADLIWSHHYFSNDWHTDFGESEMVQITDQLRQSLALDPDNPQAKTLADWIVGLDAPYIRKKGDRYDYPVLTATLTVIPSTETPFPKATSTPQVQTTSTETAQPKDTAIPVSPTKSPNTGSPVCGGAALTMIPALAAIWLAGRSKPRRR